MASVASNPWVAMDVTTDPVARSRLLRRVHERAFAGQAGSSPDVRELVRESWRRSLAAGVTPDQGGATLRLTPSELERAQERSPLVPVIGIIHSKLSTLDEDARQIVAIADAEANLLWVTGDRDTCERAREMHFEEGATWSEKGGRNERPGYRRGARSPGADLLGRACGRGSASVDLLGSAHPRSGHG